MVSTYQVVAYSSQWPDIYRRYAKRLTSLLPGAFDSLHHIGSTAVPGLSAKPIIDILGTVPEVASMDRHEGALIAHRYHALGEFGLPGRRYFVLEESGKRLVNLHVFATGSSEANRHLAFRDYLRQHDDVRDEYDRLKRMLYLAVPDDLDAYMDGKDSWIKETEQLALAFQDHRWVHPTT
jgi:GrpB-like predicted nucleotidyltransferase (UPF0157 family)